MRSRVCVRDVAATIFRACTCHIFLFIYIHTLYECASVARVLLFYYIYTRDTVMGGRNEIWTCLVTKPERGAGDDDRSSSSEKQRRTNESSTLSAEEWSHGACPF